MEGLVKWQHNNSYFALPIAEDSSQSETKETRGLAPEPKPPTETDPQWKISADSHSTTTTTTGAASLRVESELDPTTPQAQFAVLRKRLGLSRLGWAL